MIAMISHEGSLPRTVHSLNLKLVLSGLENTLNNSVGGAKYLMSHLFRKPLHTHITRTMAP